MRFSKLFVFVAVCIAALTFTSSAYAKIEPVTADGVYTMGKNDSQAFAEESAYQDALRKAADQVGVYVESYSESQGGILTKDQIKVVSASLLSVKSKEFEYDTINKQAFKIICHIKAEADASNDNLKALIEDKQKLNQSEALAKQVEKLQQEIAQLKQGATNKADLEKQYLIKAYEKNLRNANSDEIRQHYITEIRKLEPLNPEAQYALFEFYGDRNPQYVINDALNILKIDPDNYVACSSLAQIYIRQKNEEKFEYYARKGIISIRKHFTSDEIKKKTLGISENVVFIYPFELKDLAVYDLYVRYAAYHELTCTVYDEKTIKDTLKKYNIKVDDVNNVIIVSYYFEDEV
ncbi:MAG: hypothetical protein IJ862_07650 [Selenomonadaceae bacterium]|nr:hypothetical protein [Selenomonadaceae bacterium]